MTEEKTVISGGSCGNKRGGGLFMGGAMMIFGGAFLASHLGYLHGLSPWQMWPTLLIWGGVTKIVSRECGGGIVGGLILMGIGGALLANNFGIFDLRWSLIWPVLLILFGVIIFTATLRTPKKRKKAREEISVGRSFETSLIMGGREDEIHSKEFENAQISVVMGGLELDMRNAEIKGEEAIMNMKLIMGGVELWVPEHWDVISRCSPVMGGIENKIRKRIVVGDQAPKRLIIDGSIVMGGVEIRN